MANRYWVGGTATWDLTAGTKWSLTSGGAGGQAVPTAADDVFFSAASGAVTVTVSGFRVAKSVNCTGFTGTLTGPSTVGITISGSLTLVPDMNFTGGMQLFFRALGTITSAGKTFGNITLENFAATNITLNDALTMGALNVFTLTAGVLNLNNFTLTCGRFESNNLNVRSVAFGTGSIALISNQIGSAALSINQASNFTHTGSSLFTRSMISTATLAYGSTSSSGSGKPVNLNLNGGSSTCTITGGSYFKNLNFTGNSSVVNTSNLQLSGDLTFSATGTYTGFSCTVIGSSTITGNGRTVSSIDINAAGISVVLGSALTVSQSFIITQGSFNTNNFNLTVNQLLSSNSLTRSITFGTSTVTLTSSTTTSIIWDTSTSTNLTFSAESSTIVLSTANSAGGLGVTFSGGSLTYGIFNITANSVSLTIAQNNTFAQFNINGISASVRTTGSNTFTTLANSVSPVAVRLASGLTTTVGTFNLSGTAGNLVTFESNTAGTQATISVASGAVDANYLSIKDSNATGGAVFTAINSVNGGNNTGWLGFPLLSNGKMLMMFI